MKFSTNTLVDADVHNVLSSNEELFDYLPDYWIHMIRDVGNFPAGGHDWRNPMGLFRCDAKPPGGGLPASDPNYLVTHHLDANQIEYAILTGSCYGIGTACDMILRMRWPRPTTATCSAVGWTPLTGSGAPFSSITPTQPLQPARSMKWPPTAGSFKC